MKVIKVLYNNETKFIADIVDLFEDKAIIEKIDGDILKNKNKMRGIQTDFGTKNFPLVIFEDENLEPAAAIWPESSPDWEEAIRTTLDNLINN